MIGRTPAIGTLRDRVQLQRKDSAPEADGGHAVTFVPLATVWARVYALSGRETRHADGKSATISHTVVLRYRTDLAPGDRIIYRGRPLEIVSAEDLNGRRAYLSCTCAHTQQVG